MARGLRALVFERRLPYHAERAINRLLRRLGSRRRTIRAGGLRVRVRRLTVDEIFVRNIFENREYDAPGFEIAPGDTVVDIGGNIGTFALYAASQATRGRVVTVEPDGENYSLLRENLTRNRLSHAVAVRAAVAGEAGTLTLYHAKEGGGFHSVIKARMSTTDASETVTAVTLQQLFDEHRIDHCDLLKMDCEGAEYGIFATLPPACLARIDRIVMEYHNPSDGAPLRQHSDRLAAQLEDAGFTIADYVEFTGYNCGFLRATRRR